MTVTELSPVVSPPSGPAIAFAPTRDGLARHRQKAGTTFGVGLLAFLGGGLLIAVAGVLGLVVALTGFMAAGVGLFGLAANLRFRRKLEHAPWRAWPCHVALTSSGPGFVLEAPDGDRHLLLASMVKPRYPIALRCTAGTVWLAGEPAKGGVGAVPGGEDLFWLSRPIGKAERVEREILRRSGARG